MSATPEQVNGVITNLKSMADRLLDLEMAAKRITEAYDELDIAGYITDPNNIDASTGFIENVQPITPADVQNGAFLASMIQAFMRGTSPANNEYYRTATKLQPMG